MTEYYSPNRWYRKGTDKMEIQKLLGDGAVLHIPSQELRQAVTKLYPEWFDKKPEPRTVDEVHQEMERLRTLRQRFERIEEINRHLTILKERLREPNMANQGAELNWNKGGKNFHIPLECKDVLKFCQQLVNTLTHELDGLTRGLEQ